MLKLRWPIKKKSSWDMNPREKLVDRKWDKLKDFLEALPKRIPQDLDLIMRTLDVNETSPSVYDSYVSISMPFDRSLLPKVKDLMRGLGWYMKKERLEKGDDQLEYSKEFENLEIHFRFSHWTSGSTCKRVKIGSETITRDVYDVVCNEAAAEMGQ